MHINDFFLKESALVGGRSAGSTLLRRTFGGATFSLTKYQRPLFCFAHGDTLRLTFAAAFPCRLRRHALAFHHRIHHSYPSSSKVAGRCERPVACRFSFRLKPRSRRGSNCCCGKGALMRSAPQWAVVACQLSDPLCAQLPIAPTPSSREAVSAALKLVRPLVRRPPARNPHLHSNTLLTTRPPMGCRGPHSFHISLQTTT